MAYDASLKTLVDVPAVGSCSAGVRTAGNIQRTVDHEDRHLGRLMWVINDRQNVRRDYPTKTECDSKLEEFRDVFWRRWNATASNQECYRDEYFQNERVHVAACLTPSPSSVEVATDQTSYGKCGFL